MPVLTANRSCHPSSDFDLQAWTISRSVVLPERLKLAQEIDADPSRVPIVSNNPLFMSDLRGRRLLAIEQPGKHPVSYVYTFETWCDQAEQWCRCGSILSWTDSDGHICGKSRSGLQTSTTGIQHTCTGLIGCRSCL